MAWWIDRISVHRELLILLTCVSVATFVGSLLAVPWLIARAPRDFFKHQRTTAPKRSLPVRVFKNLTGLALVAMGSLMLFLPGQGVLTIIVGLALLDLPGRHAVLAHAGRRRNVMRALNYIRERAHREPFDPPE